MRTHPPTGTPQSAGSTTAPASRRGPPRLLLEPPPLPLERLIYCPPPASACRRESRPERRVSISAEVCTAPVAQPPHVAGEVHLVVVARCWRAIASAARRLPRRDTRPDAPLPSATSLRGRPVVHVERSCTLDGARLRVQPLDPPQAARRTRTSRLRCCRRSCTGCSSDGLRCCRRW